ncbi:hypothetical protein CEXT_310551 [Caerostris extrusa]|uniref:DIX domain-containing protein n=1 Tax=Caerostris extrusa TaxID=172846 RepID=A0AAV4UZE5_CAEEX|nr:hypothetical protein CEXT_310551 [Caerostris extrusa]
MRSPRHVTVNNLLGSRGSCRRSWQTAGEPELNRLLVRSVLYRSEKTQGLGKISQVGRGDRGSHGTSWKNKLKWKSMRKERKTCTDPPNENIQEENIKLKKIIEEKEQEISKLKLLMSAQTKNFKYPYSVPARIQKEELQVVAEALGSLRRCFPANDPRQHTLDTVDQSLAALLERINALEMTSAAALVSFIIIILLTCITLYSSSTVIRRSPSDRDTPSHLLLKSQGESSNGQQPNDSNSTKVVYYMDKSLTPFRCTLQKRIGEATLRDFKLLFDRPGQYRYHFKTLDPEFGMVKEEVHQDGDILPGWDSKIVAWIEEECN